MYNGSMETGRWRGACRISFIAAACATTCAGALLLTASAQPRRRGEIVRVERSRTPSQNLIRLCPTPTGDGQLGTCYGTAPRRGEHALLFDYDENYLGSLVVESSESSGKNQCHHNTVFDYTFRATIQSATGQNVPFAVAVFGMKLNTQVARLITGPPDQSGFQPEKAKPWMGVDEDGDGIAEMVVTAYDCSDEETPPVAQGGQNYETYCLDYWQQEGANWRKLQRDIFYTCG